MITLEIIEKIQETPRAVTLVLKPLSGPMPYQAGQFLTFLFDDLSEKPFRRSYSLSSAPGLDPLPSITVKRTVNGLASRFLVEEAQVGMQLQALAPSGQFTLDKADKPRDIFLIGGGSGISPLFGLLKSVLVNEPQSNLILILADSSSKSIIFQKKLGDLARQNPANFTCLHLLSRTDDEVHKTIFPPATWIPGRLSNALVEELVTRFQKYSDEDARFFLCGPEGLVLKSRQALRFMGYEEEQIKREVFVIKSSFKPPASLFPLSQVSIKYKDQEHQVAVQPGQTILEAAIQGNLDLPYSCKTGVCTACSAQCESGEVQMYTQLGMMSSSTSKGLVLTCTGYPTTPVVKLII